jgi:hypothetical protein
MADAYKLLERLSDAARIGVAAAGIEHVVELYKKADFQYLVGATAKVIGAPAEADMIETAIKLAWRSAESGKPVSAKVLDAFAAGTKDPPEDMDPEDMALPAVQIVDIAEALLEATHEPTAHGVAKLLESCIDALSDMVASVDEDAERVCAREQAWQKKLITHATKLGKKKPSRASFKVLLDKPAAFKTQLAKYAKDQRGPGEPPLKSSAKVATTGKPRKRVPRYTFDDLERFWPKIPKPARVAIACAVIERIRAPHVFGNYKITVKEVASKALKKYPPSKDLLDVMLELGWGFVAGKALDDAVLVAIDTWIKKKIFHKSGGKKTSSTALCAYKAGYHMLREIRCEQLDEDPGYNVEECMSMASVGVAIDLGKIGVGDDDYDPEDDEQAWQLRVFELAMTTAKAKQPVTRALFAELLAEPPFWQAYEEKLKKSFGGGRAPQG